MPTGRKTPTQTQNTQTLTNSVPNAAIFTTTSYGLTHLARTRVEGKSRVGVSDPHLSAHLTLKVFVLSQLARFHDDLAMAPALMIIRQPDGLNIAHIATAPRLVYQSTKVFCFKKDL